MLTERLVQNKFHLKLQLCFDKRKYQAHILSKKYDTEKCQSYPVCLTLLLWHTVTLSEMNITGTLPQAGNLKLFVPSLSTQGSTRPKQNMFNIVLMRPDKTE